MDVGLTIRAWKISPFELLVGLYGCETVDPRYVPERRAGYGGIEILIFHVLLYILDWYICRALPARETILEKSVF